MALWSVVFPMAKIYTKTGDSGETGLLGGVRVRKDSARVAACGVIDELNSVLGLARAEQLDADDDQILATIQHHLFRVGQEIATPEPAVPPAGRIGSAEVDWLEMTIDRLDALLPPLKEFILPGGTRTAAALHLARSICRRGERSLVQLGAETDLSMLLMAYLNRLSDLLFVLARWVNQRNGQSDVPWQQTT
jgi:cob(I)alamin adenosyltransferase